MYASVMWAIIGSGNGFAPNYALFGAKPLPAQMLIYYELNP